MNKRRIVVLLALAITAAVTFSLNAPEASAIGGFLKNKFKQPAQQTEATTQDNSTSPAENPDQPKAAKSNEPQVFENTKYKFKFTYPGSWDLTDDDPKKSTVSVTDLDGEKGTFIAHATWMSDDFPVEPAFQALIKQAEDRKKHGELEEYYVKNITVQKNGKPVDIVKGVVIIESNEDPTMKRMQWQAYGGGNYYNFTTSTSVANFPNYKDKFKEMIDSIEFHF
ncbi:MAG: hypothetical protein AB1782_08605 [Cyanobacteriota bacterium]